MKIALWRKIFHFPTYLRFKKIFEELEIRGYDLFVGNLASGALGERQVRRYIKRTQKVSDLYNKFQSK